MSRQAALTLLCCCCCWGCWEGHSFHAATEGCGQTSRNGPEGRRKQILMDEERKKQMTEFSPQDLFTPVTSSKWFCIRRSRSVADGPFWHSSSLAKGARPLVLHPFRDHVPTVLVTGDGPLPCLKLFMKPSRGGNLSGSCTTRWGTGTVRTAGIRRPLGPGKHVEPVHEHCLDEKRRHSDSSLGSLPGDLEPALSHHLQWGKWIVMGKTARGISLIKFLIH